MFFFFLFFRFDFGRFHLYGAYIAAFNELGKEDTSLFAIISMLFDKVIFEGPNLKVVRHNITCVGAMYRDLTAGSCSDLVQAPPEPNVVAKQCQRFEPVVVSAARPADHQLSRRQSCC